MYELLQVECEGVAIGADDDVAADACGPREIAIGVRDADVVRIVAGGDSDLVTRGLRELLAASERPGNRGEKDGSGLEECAAQHGMPRDGAYLLDSRRGRDVPKRIRILNISGLQFRG